MAALFSSSGASPAATGLVTVFRSLPQALPVPDPSLPLSLSLGQVTNDTGVLVLFCRDLPGQG